MTTDLVQASLDGLIDWVRKERRQTPNVSLAELLRERKIAPSRWSEQRLVDLACVDLMHRRRSGHLAHVEEYLADFPLLQRESNQLDLIDAELCVSRELGEETPIELYVERFPGLATQIRELIQLNPGKSLAGSAGLAEPEASGLESTSNLIKLIDQPLEIPDWFIAGHSVCSTPGDLSRSQHELKRWLIRGRDATRGTPVALKVLQLSSTCTSDDCDRILDDCAAATNVKNQCWVSPSMAAIQHRHLCVIRPWVHGRTLRETWTSPVSRSQLMHLASVAQTIASAHLAGTHHGGLHADNVVVDHKGIARVVDAGSSLNVASGWTKDQRVAHDIRSLTRLVRSASEIWRNPSSKQLAGTIKQLAETSADDPCYAIGECLIQQADLAGFDY